MNFFTSFLFSCLHKINYPRVLWLLSQQVNRFFNFPRPKSSIFLVFQKCLVINLFCRSSTAMNEPRVGRFLSYTPVIWTGPVTGCYGKIYCMLAWPLPRQKEGLKFFPLPSEVQPPSWHSTSVSSICRIAWTNNELNSQAKSIIGNLSEMAFSCLRFK